MYEGRRRSAAFAHDQVRLLLEAVEMMNTASFLYLGAIAIFLPINTVAHIHRMSPNLVNSDRIGEGSAPEIVNRGQQVEVDPRFRAGRSGREVISALRHGGRNSTAAAAGPAQQSAALPAASKPASNIEVGESGLHSDASDQLLGLASGKGDI